MTQQFSFFKKFIWAASLLVLGTQICLAAAEKEARTAPAEGKESSLSALDPRDPFEKFNRHTYIMNDKLDRTIFKPVATAYNKVLPSPVRTGVSNFFNNLNEVPTLINDLLQANFYQATAATWRLVLNSTLGVFGLFDIAKHMGLPKHHQDFGITLAKWGIEPSYYIVMPFFGPRTTRDSIAFGVDFKYFNLLRRLRDVSTRNRLLALDAVNNRAKLLGSEKVLEQAALDPYAFLRDAYLQRRSNQIRKLGSGKFYDHPTDEDHEAEFIEDEFTDENGSE